MNEMSDAGRDELRSRFDESMESSLALFKQHAFRKSLLYPALGRSVLNMALFDVCSVILTQWTTDVLKSRADEVRSAISILLRDRLFEHSITYSTNSRRQVEMRFERMEAALKGVFA